MKVDYEKLTDWQINALVALAHGYDIDSKETSSEGSVLRSVGTIGTYWMNFITDPKSAWPLIWKNRISLQSTGTYYKAVPALGVTGKSFISDGDDPIRACLLVYLSMGGDALVAQHLRQLEKLKDWSN